MNTSTQLWLTESAYAAMTTAAARSHPDETGGVLVGVHLDGHPWITAAVEIHTTDRGLSHYRIPAGATQAAVLGARATDHRLGYLGDWHSHPADLGPSTTDFASLALISIKHPRTPNPTQIVVRRTNVGYALDARRIVTVVPRVCAIRLTGALPGTTQRPYEAIDPDDPPPNDFLGPKPNPPKGVQP